MGVGHEEDRWSAVRKDCRRLGRVLLKCLTLQSVFAKTAEVKWPGKGPEITGPEVHMGAKSFLSSCEEVKNILRRESGTSQ